MKVKLKQFTNRQHPVLTFCTKQKLDLQFLDENGDPIRFNETDTFDVSVDSNFKHDDSLMAYTENVTLVDAENGIIELEIDCSASSFGEKLGCRKEITGWIEIARYSLGSSDPEIILLDTVTCLNRVHTDEGAPSSESVPEYLTALQVRSLFNSGVILQFSADGTDWHSDQRSGDSLVRFRLAAEGNHQWSAPIDMPKITSVSLAKCSGLGEYLAENAFTMTWIDPDDVILNGATLAQWNQTVLVRKVGSYPEDQTDGTVLATTSRALGNKNAYRSNGFTDSNRESGTTYYYKLFSQTTAGVWNNLTGNQFVEDTDMSWGMIQAFVRAGRGPDLFPVGTVFEVEHPEYTADGHGIYFRVVGHDQVPAADETLTHTMCLDMVDCLFNAPYDSNEMNYALTADTTAKAAKTYYKLEDSSYTALVEGTDYEVGDAVPVASWYEKNIVTNSGRSNFKESNVLQWANSSGNANQWFTPQNLFDTCSNALISKNGFLKNIDPDFLSVVQPAAIISCYVETPYDQGKYRVISDAKFWLLSRSQITGDFQAENEQLEYYQDGGDTKKCLAGNTSPVKWWTRTCRVGGTADLGMIVETTSRQYYGGYVNASQYISLACIIA